MAEKAVTPKHVTPAAPLSPAIQAQGFVFVSGQVGIDAAGRLTGADVGTQTSSALENIGRILQERGAGLDAVIKTVVYLVDVRDLAAMNESYRRALADPLPARSTVIVAALPRPGALVEIEAVAVIVD